MKDMEFEVPYFDNGNWTVQTRHGIIWEVFPDSRNNDPLLFNEAVKATSQIIKTGTPLVGGWG